MADSSENSLCATTIRHSYENRPRPTVFVGAGFKPASQYQRHPHTVIPAESLHPVPRYGAGIQSPAICRARTDRPTHCHRRGCRRQSPWRIPLKIACVPPPSVIPTKIAPRPPPRRGGFQTRLSIPTPSPHRHSREGVTPYHDTGPSSTISPVTTQRPPTLSFQVVRVATLMTYSERILPHLSFRTQRSEVRNL